MDFELISMLVGAPIELLLGGPLLLTVALFVFSERKPKEDNRSLKEIRRKNAVAETPIVGWGSVVAGLAVIGLAGTVIHSMASEGVLDLLVQRFLT